MDNNKLDYGVQYVFRKKFVYENSPAQTSVIECPYQVYSMDKIEFPTAVNSTHLYLLIEIYSSHCTLQSLENYNLLFAKLISCTAQFVD